MLGGEHGKLTYGPPEGYSQVYESLQPNETLSIQPCFACGDIVKGIMSGPKHPLDTSAFVPHPVETGHVSTQRLLVQLKQSTKYICELFRICKVLQEI